MILDGEIQNSKVRILLAN